MTDSLLDKADEATIKAFESTRLVDAFHHFQIAEGLYKAACATYSAEWAHQKAAHCWKVLCAGGK